jgi:two-component system sensor histidine kinase CpxA
MNGRFEHWAKRIRRAPSLWLLLVLFLCCGTGLVAVNSILMFGRFRGHLTEVCAAAYDAYERGGPDSLRSVLEGSSLGPGLRIHLLDSAGRDLATGQVETGLVLQAKSSLVPPYGANPALIVDSPVYSCMAERLASDPGIPFGPLAWVLPFISILCCTVGVYITWRMRKIEAALNHFAEGELAVRMVSDSGDSIGRLARAFNRMAERIESLVASHQRLCESMAHELRSPLTRLMMAIPRVRRGTTGALEQIEVEASRVNDLVEELLEVARAEVDPSALQLEPVNLQCLLAEIADRCEIEAKERNCEIQLTFSDPGSIIGDAELLRRAIENVLRNAVRHTGEGTRIHVYACGDADSAAISIRDWGPGVPIGALTEIFKPFYRVETARDRTAGGVGLGLAIAQRAIAVHRGTILADNSAPGLRVTIRLPREHARSRAS